MPETPEEIIARRMAGRGAPAPASGSLSPEEVIRRRRASKAPATPPRTQDPGMKRALAGFVPVEEQDERMKGDFGRQAFARLATSDPITRTLTGVAAGFGDIGEDVYGPLREAADAGDPEAAARLADFAARSKPGLDAGLRTGTDAALAALSVLGTGAGNLGKGTEILAKGGSAVRGALSAPIATTVLSGLQATPGGHKVLDAAPGAAKAAARALGAEEGGKVEGAAGVVGAAAPALMAAWFGGRNAPQLAKTVASELGQVGIMGGGANIPQALGVDPSSGAGMALGLAGTVVGQAGAGKVERGIVERQAQKGRLARELKAVTSHIEEAPTPARIEDQAATDFLTELERRKEAMKGVAGGVQKGAEAVGAREERVSDLEAAQRPPAPRDASAEALAEGVEGPPKPVDPMDEAIAAAKTEAEKQAIRDFYATGGPATRPGRPVPFRVPTGGKPPREGPGMDPEAFRDAKEGSVPLTPEAERINREARRPLDDLLAESKKHREAQQAAKDRAASDEWARGAAFDEAEAAWNNLAPAERAAKVNPLLEIGVLRPGEATKPWERLDWDQQEHIQAILKDPSAFADAMPEEVAPGQPKAEAVRPAGEVPPPVPPPPAEAPAAPVPDAPPKSGALFDVNPDKAPVFVPDAQERILENAAGKWWDTLNLKEKHALSIYFQEAQPETIGVVDLAAPWNRLPEATREHLADVHRMDVAAGYSPWMDESVSSAPPAPPRSPPAPTAGVPESGSVPTVPAAGEAPGALPSSQPPTGDLPPAGKSPESGKSVPETPLNPDEPPPPRKPPGKGSTFLGSGLGGLQKNYESLSPEHRRIVDGVLKGALGGGAGYGVGALTEDHLPLVELKTPEQKAAYRWAMAALGAYRGMGNPYWKQAVDFTLRGASRLPGAKGVAKAFTNPREAISTKAAEVIRAAGRDGSLADIDGSVIAHGLPKVPDEILYPYLGGELGSKRAYQEHLATLGPEAAAAADQAVEAARTLIRRLSEDRVRYGGISEETHAERFADAVDKVEHGFLNRVFLENFADGAKPSYAGMTKAQRPKLWQERVRDDGHGAVVALNADTVHEILAEAGIENPWMTQHGTVIQKGNNTLVKWEPTEAGKYNRDLFLEALKDHARQRSEVMVGPGKTGGVGHISQRLKDAPGLRVTLSRPQIKKMLGDYGIPAPESIEASGQRHAVRWPDTPDGMAAADAFEVAIRDYAKSEATHRIGEGSSGGTGHLLIREVDPLPMEIRRDLGEVGFEQGGAKAQTFLTTSRIGHQVANLKMFDAIAKTAGDEKGAWTMEIPDKVGEDGQPVRLPGGQKAKADGRPAKIMGEDVKILDGPDGTEFVALDGDRGKWGALAGKAIRRDWWEYLNATKNVASSTDVAFQSAMGRWRASKVNTTRGAIRNGLGNFYFSHLAGTAPWFPDTLPHYFRVGDDFLKAWATKDLSSLRKYVERYGVDVYPEDLTGDTHANELIRSVRDGAMDARKVKAGKIGRAVGDVITGGMLSEGIGKVKGPVLASTLGAAANAGYGYLKGESGEDITKRAALGAGAGALGNLGYRQLARAYGLTDAYFKAVAGETLVARGKSIPEARRIVRERFQTFSEMTPVEEALSGKKAGLAGGAAALALNPFMRFYTQLVRTTANTARENPAAAATGILLLPIIAEAVERISGVFTGREEDRRAAHAQKPTAIHYKAGDGKIDRVDVGPILPWSDMAEDVRSSVSGDSRSSDAVRRLFSMTLGGGPVAETLRSPQVLMDPNAKSMRTGYPIAEPGESGGDAFARTLMNTWFHPSTPGGGTDWRRIEESVTEKYKKGSRKQEVEPGRAAVSVGLGMNTSSYDPEKTLKQLRSQRDRDMDAAEARFDRAMNDAQFRSNPERVKRQRAILKSEIEAVRKRFDDARKRLLPAPVGR